MRIDLHGLPLSEAKMKSQISVAEAWSTSNSSIELIHGYHLGNVIKDYIQDEDGLRRDIENIYPEVSILKLKDKGLGATVISFRRN
jgi:hypothetical protein|tara:strand:- start:843 stop:1100 length:258 start_codon:yes stop_codon:yes gene_type:complete